MKHTQVDLVMLRPDQLVTKQNVRFALKPWRVKELAESIERLGGVHTNLKVEPTDEKDVFAIREGHYRCAAVMLLHKKGKTDFLLPCEVEEPLEGAERLRHQLSENMDRENLSPMDMATAIKELRDSGLEQPAICDIFKVTGGKKGLEVRPMSRRVFFLYQSFLKFPKKIQTLIHEGILTVADAQRLAAKPQEQWDAIITDAEARLAKSNGLEEAEDGKFLEGLKKAEEAEQKAKQDAEALVKAQQIAKQKADEVAAKVKESADALVAAKAIPAKNKEARAKAEEAFKAKEKEAKDAEKAAADAQKQAEKLQEKAEKQAADAAERRAKLEEARAQAVKNAGGKQTLDVTKAAAGQGDGKVKLNAVEMRRVVEDLAKPSGFPKTQQLFAAVLRCFNSEITDTQLLSEVAFMMGERKDKPKTMKGATKEVAKKTA